MCIATQQQTAEDLFSNMSCEPTKAVTVSQATETTVSMSDFSSSSQEDESSATKALHQSLSDDSAIVTGKLSCVDDYYRILPKVVGSGHYGIVRRCISRRTRERLAIKTIDKSKIENTNMLKREIEILSELDHPGVIKMHSVHEDEQYLHIITELCEGGELFDRISDKYRENEPLYAEKDAAKLLYAMLDAVSYCHDNNIAHRDIKPENFIFTNSSEDSPIKLIDFGLARKHDSLRDAPLSDLIGTPYYMAPEVLDRCHEASCDIWSIGVVAYVLLCGYPPFYGSDEEIFAMIQKGNFCMSAQPWDQISDSAKDFVCSLMNEDPYERLTAKEAMQHPWIQSHLAPKKRRNSNVEMEDCPESPRKKFKEDAILFEYEVSKADVDSIRCILNTTFTQQNIENPNVVQPCSVVTPTLE